MESNREERKEKGVFQRNVSFTGGCAVLQSKRQAAPKADAFFAPLKQCASTDRSLRTAPILQKSHTSALYDLFD